MPRRRRPRSRAPRPAPPEPEYPRWSTGLARGWKLVLAAAAAVVTLTGAFTAVRGVVHHERTTPTARISNVSAVGPESLADFRLRQRIAPTASSASGATLLAQAGETDTTAVPPVTETAPPAVTETVPATTGATPAPGASAPLIATVPDDSATVELCFPDAPPDSPLRCPDAAAAARARAAENGAVHRLNEALTAHLEMGDACARDVQAAACPLHDLAETGGRRAFRQIVAGVRATRSRAGAGERAELLGMVVSFDADLEDLEGQDVAVTWTVYGLGRVRGLAAGWFEDRQAVRWTVESRRDHGSADVWIPLPPRPGRYFARVSLREEDGTRLTYADTERFR